MRQAFVETVTRLLDENERIVLLLGDISVHAFQVAAKRHPKRVINCGVSEQAMVSMGAGLARAGMYPIMHTIAPFLVERAFEQIKIDFGYHSLPGCFVSVGASYDYSTLGCTHHCPGDVALMLTVPGMEVYVPGHSKEVARLLPRLTDGALAYLRLSEDQDNHPCDHDIAGGDYFFRDSYTMVIAVGPTSRLVPPTPANILHLRRVDKLPGYFDVSAVPPDDAQAGFKVNKLLILEPFYEGTLTHLVTKTFWSQPITIKSIGVPRGRFLTEYGTRQELDAICGLTKENVARELEALLHG